MEQVVELTDGIPAIFRTSKVELARSLEEAKSSLSKLSAFLTVVLFTVGILNFINTMSVSILDRQREFAAMKAVGASGRQVRDLITWEGIWYFVFTLALSVTAGVIISSSGWSGSIWGSGGLRKMRPQMNFISFEVSLGILFPLSVQTEK